jgi:hypothetical protein
MGPCWAAAVARSRVAYLLWSSRQLSLRPSLLLRSLAKETLCSEDTRVLLAVVSYGNGVADQIVL